MDNIDLHVARLDLKVKELRSNTALAYPLPDIRLLDYAAEAMWRRWVLMFRTHVPANVLLNYTKPQNWHEAFKERWFPKWALQRWPVRYDTFLVGEILANVAIPRNYGDVFTICSFNGSLIPRKDDDDDE